MNLLFENFEKLIDAPGGIERARGMILQLAVRGKLVKQDPKDEPASELLKRIKKGKEILIAEGKIKKQKELPPIKDEEKQFKIPKGWEWVRFQNITSVITCGMASTPTYTESGRMFLSAKNVKPYKFLPYDYKFVSEETYKKIIQNAKPELYDILLTRVGAGIGEACLIDQEIDFAYYVSLTLIKPIQSCIASEYLLHYLSSPLGISNAISKTFGIGVSQGNLNVNQVRRYIIPLPPLKEQKRIVEKANSLMALLDELEEKKEKRNQKRIKLNDASLNRLLNSKDEKELKSIWKRIEENFTTLYSVPENVEKLKQSILQLAVQGKLVKQDPNDEPASELLKKIKNEKEKLIAEGKIKKQKELPPIKDEEKPLELPKGWEWVRLNDVFNFIDYRGKTPIKTEYGIRLITAKNIRPGIINKNPEEYITEETYKKWMTRGLPRMGDLLFTTEAPLGNVALVNLNEKFALAQRVINFQPYLSFDTKFMLIALMSKSMQDQYWQSATGMTAKGIKAARLKLIPIPIPPISEQKRIVEKVNELMSLCNSLEEKLKKKEETAEKLVGAVVNTITNGKQPHKEANEVISDLMVMHEKALEKLK